MRREAALTGEQATPKTGLTFLRLPAGEVRGVPPTFANAWAAASWTAATCWRLLPSSVSASSSLPLSSSASSLAATRLCWFSKFCMRTHH